MSNPLKKQIFNNDGIYEQNHSYYDCVEPPVKRHRVLVKKKKKNAFKRFIASLFAVGFLGAYGYYICPYNYEHYFAPLFLNRILNNNYKVDSRSVLSQSAKYINNSYFIDGYQLIQGNQKTKEITDITIVSEMNETKKEILELAKQYPKIEPSIFVWEYSTGAGFEINANKVFSSASIIKVPIAFELMRLVDETSKTMNPISLTDKRTFGEEYRTLGSGDLQYTKADVAYTLDYLANIMIADSDNSATNMILNEIGGVDSFNRSMRNLGLKVTSMGEWLPDLSGKNKITAREISKILYNIDNPNYINPKFKNVLKEYLGNTKNIHLIKEKLPKDVMVLHKTGDIGSMLGDTGIVYANNGKKYIVTILVKRPHNYYGAKTFIQDASLIIYNSINSL
ncbi:serine hydrolase [bacterium]|nr:serine hydrolase [bacterium]